MPAYLVRLKENKEIVGIFVSADKESLSLFVDECCDPAACEYTKLGNGGLFLANRGAPAVPHIFNEDFDNEAPDWFAGATISDLWPAFFEEAKWKPVLDCYELIAEGETD